MTGVQTCALPIYQLAFRQNVIGTFAWLMEDEGYSDVLCKLLQKSNRFFIPSKLQAKPLYWEKQQEFFNWFENILLADQEQIIKDGSYVFPAFAQPKYDLPPEYLKQQNIPSCYVIPNPEPGASF